MAEIYKEAERFKTALLRRDRQAAMRLISAYAKIWTKTSKNLQKLINQIEDAKARGVDYSPAWLFQQQRYRELIDQITREMAKYAEFATNEITREQRAAIKAAINDSNRLLLTAAQNGGAAVNASFAKLSASTVENMAGFLSDGSPLKNLLNELPRAARQAVADSLTEAVTLGYNPRKTASKIRYALGGNLTRALRISRTETMRAYRETTSQTYKANSDVLEGWYWLATLNRRTCAACIALNGSFHDLDERMASHVQCLIPGETVIASRIQGATQRWYAGEVVEIHTFGGNTLTVTPNHPILTPSGWVAAGDLNESSYVFSSQRPDRIFSAICPDDHHAPAPIEQIVQSFRESRGMLLRRVPSSAEYFHGDGKNGEIDIVGPDRLLRYRLDPQAFQQGSELDFVGRLMGQPILSHTCPESLFSLALLPAPGRDVGSPGVDDMLFRGSLFHHQAIRVSYGSSLDSVFRKPFNYDISRDAKTVSDRFFGLPGQVSRDDVMVGQVMAKNSSKANAGFLKEADNDLVGHAKSLCELLAGMTGLVQIDQIRKLVKRSFCGHVYNLQTESGWYSAGGIITHNCRCTQLPAIKGGDPPIEQGEKWFEAQDEQTQRAILESDAAFEAYKAGELKLTDLVGRRDSPQWGTSYFHLSLKRALAGQGQFPGYRG